MNKLETTHGLRVAEGCGQTPTPSLAELRYPSATSVYASIVVLSWASGDSR